jgi:hypothetical protein
MTISLNILSATAYRGREFLEYCVSEGCYMEATRDRSPCSVCVLEELCQAGFEEQVRRVNAGENPSLTEEMEVPDPVSAWAEVRKCLTSEQVEFILTKIGAT